MEVKRESLFQNLNMLARLLCLLAVAYFAVRCIDSCSEEEEIAIEDTPVVIESIKPIGELYAYTAITEDFSIDNVEKVGFFRKSYYKAVQTLRMQVSYVLSLDSVGYQRLPGSDTVVVSLPPLRYQQSPQGGRLLCEVEMADYDAASAIQVVEQKIRSKYDTPENREKALQHVREVLATFVVQCGLIPKFEETK